MNHRKTGRILSRTRNQRRALLKTLFGSLILHEHIQTTEAKAKEVKLHIDQLVNKAKLIQTDEARKIGMIRDLRKRLPLMAVEKLSSPEFISRFSERGSGYTRVVKLQARKGDGARMAIIEFV